MLQSVAEVRIRGFRKYPLNISGEGKCKEAIQTKPSDKTVGVFRKSLRTSWANGDCDVQMPRVKDQNSRLMSHSE